MQPAPAAEPHHPVSGRLVCSSRIGPLRAGTPPSHHDGGDGIPSVLALIGGWDALPELWRFRGQNKGAWVAGSLAVSLGSLQPFPSSPTVGCAEIPRPNHAMEKEEVLDGRKILPPGPRLAPQYDSEQDLSRSTHLPRGGIQRGRQAVLTEILVAGDSFSAQPVRRSLSQPAKVCRRIFCADRIGFACEEFRRQNA